MRTDDLIQQLSSDLIPVRPQMSPWRFALTFALVCFLIIGLGLVAVHIRGDWENKFSDTSFLIDLLLSFGLLVTSLSTVGWLSAPGRGHRTLARYLLIALGTGVVVFAHVRVSVMSLSDSRAGLDVVGMKCFLTVLVFSLLPFLALAWATRKRAPVYPTMVGIAIALAGIGAGTLAITLHCNVDNGMHIALWHFVFPLVVGLALGGTILAKSLRW